MSNTDVLGVFPGFNHIYIHLQATCNCHWHQGLPRSDTSGILRYLGVMIRWCYNFLEDMFTLKGRTCWVPFLFNAIKIDQGYVDNMLLLLLPRCEITLTFTKLFPGPFAPKKAQNDPTLTSSRAGSDAFAHHHHPQRCEWSDSSLDPHIISPVGWRIPFRCRWT